MSDGEALREVEDVLARGHADATSLASARSALPAGADELIRRNWDFRPPSSPAGVDYLDVLGRFRARA
jgi:hypothetical protein